MSEVKKGKSTSPKTEFKKGQIPWNKGKVGIQSKENNPFYGMHHSKETKEIVSKKAKERYEDGQIPWNKGQTKETNIIIKEMGDKRRGKFKGERHHCWKGGKSTEIKLIRASSEMNDWRKSVFKRDGYTCQYCHDKGKKGHAVILNAHHIKSFAKYPDDRFNIDNAITLCQYCHRLVHSTTVLNQQ